MKKLPISPLLSIAAVLMVPAVTQAQTSTTPTAPSTPSAATAPSTPSSPSGAVPGTWDGPTTFPGLAGLPVQSTTPRAPADIFQLRAGASVERDSNVLRQPVAVSDTIGSVSVGLKADKRYGLQRLRADVEATAYKFKEQSGLDYNTINYNLAWDWSITTKLHGVISADRKQYRETFLESGTGINRVGRRTERTELAEGIYEMGAAWRLLAGVANTTSESTQPGSWDASPEVRSAHVGVGYELASGTSLTGRLRRGDGEYTDASAGAAREFKETEADVVLKLPLTGKTAVEARAGHIDREHAGAPQRDFKGFIGNATANWEVTGKTRVMAGLSRYLSATGAATGGYVESDQIWLGPVWKPTVHTAVKLRWERTSREWRDVPAASTDAGRQEVIQAVMAGFDWEPRPAFALSTSIRREQLKSNVYQGYRATIFGVAAKVYF